MAIEAKNIKMVVSSLSSPYSLHLAQKYKVPYFNIEMVTPRTLIKEGLLMKAVMALP